jgi:hypothetical protein
MKIEVGVLQLYADTFHFLKKKKTTQVIHVKTLQIFLNKKRMIFWSDCKIDK